MQDWKMRKWKTLEESARVEITRVNNVAADCSKYGKPIVIWLDKMTVTLSHRSSILQHHHLCERSVRGYLFCMGVKICPFPLTRPVAINSALALPRNP